MIKITIRPLLLTINFPVIIFPPCLFACSSTTDCTSSNWYPSDDVNGDIGKTCVLLAAADKFSYDLVSRGEISSSSCPSGRCGLSRGGDGGRGGCGCDGCAPGGGGAFPVDATVASPAGNQQCFQLRRQMEHCYERANFVTMTTAAATNGRHPPDIQFGLEDRRFRSQAAEPEGGSAGGGEELETRRYYTSVELG